MSKVNMESVDIELNEFDIMLDSEYNLEMKLAAARTFIAKEIGREPDQSSSPNNGANKMAALQPPIASYIVEVERSAEPVPPLVWDKGKRKAVKLEGLDMIVKM